MINNPTAIAKYKIQEGVSEYPIGFKYSDNADGTPQLVVRINGSESTYGEHWTLSKDKTAVVVLASEQEGATLTVAREIPLVQESDYQVGRIDPEQIEADFDASVERDQMLDEHHAALTERVRRDEEHIDENTRNIEALQEDQKRQDGEITQVKSDVAKANTTAEKAVTTAEQAVSKAEQAIATANEAKGTSDNSLNLAEQAYNTAVNASQSAMFAVDTAQGTIINSNKAIETANAAKSESEKAVATANEAKATADGLAADIADAKSLSNQANMAATTAQATANEAKQAVDGKQDKGDYATNASVKTAITAERSVSDGKYLTIADSKSFALKTALDSTNKMVDQHTQEISDVMGDISALEADKQDKLTAGANITIVDNVISSTGGGSSTNLPDAPLAYEGSFILTKDWSSDYYWETLNAILTKTQHTGPNWSLFVGNMNTLFGDRTYGNYSIHYGNDCRGTSYLSISMGNNTYTTGERAIAIGYQAQALADNAIQLGNGANDAPNTFKVFDTTMLDNTSHIPASALADGGSFGQVLKHDLANGLYWDDASSGGGADFPAMSDETVGKYLTNDGSAVQWSSGKPLENMSASALAIGLKKFDSATWNSGSVYIAAPSNDLFFGSIAGNTIGIGSFTSTADDSVHIGTLASSGKNGVAIGRGASAPENGIFIGSNANAATPSGLDKGCMYVSLVETVDYLPTPHVYKLLDTNGHIPGERLAADGTEGQVLSKTADGMAWVDAGSGGGSAGGITNEAKNGLVINANVEPSYYDSANTIVISTPDSFIKPNIANSTTAVGGGCAPSDYSAAFGTGAGNVTSKYSVSIGYGAQAGNGGIFIGYGRNIIGSNLDERSMYVSFPKNPSGIMPESDVYKLLSGDGLIPAARHAEMPEEDGTYVLKMVKSGDEITMQWVKE